MKITKVFLSTLGIAIFSGLLCQAEEHHRATHLGNPATRFAPTIHTVEELRSRYRDEKLRRDMVEILRQWGWPGKVMELFEAAATNQVSEYSIAIGTTMPFMSSREDGKPICLRNVLCHRRRRTRSVDHGGDGKSVLCLCRIPPL